MDRTSTGAIKGIALVLMFIHHLFCFPEFLIDSVYYPGIQTFADLFCMPTNICVPIFAFLTGYFYAFAKKRNLIYSVRKISDIYISYWIVYLVLLALAIIWGCCEFSLFVFAYELTAARTEIMVFCWYVIFYTVSMLLLPVLTGKRGQDLFMDIVMVFFLPIITGSVLTKMYLGGIWYNFAYYLLDWFPVISVGYLFAKYDLFDSIFDCRICQVSSNKVKIFIFILAVISACAGRYWCNYFYLGELNIRGDGFNIVFKTDILYAPLFIWGISNLLQYIRNGSIIKILNLIGKHSLLMWFLHCAFYNVSRDVLQPILYAPKNPIFVLLWGLILCLIPSLILNPVIVLLQKWKNKILDFILKPFL